MTFTSKFDYLDGKQMDNLYPVKGNFLLVIAWFGATLTGLAFALFFYFYISITKISIPKTTTYQLYLALPTKQVEIEEVIISLDGRVKVVEEFFKNHQSVLEEEAITFIQVADKYKLDWRLLPSIAMQESNGGRRMINNSYNPFGFGIYGSKVIRFENFEDGIETVGKSLREDYLNQGLTTPEAIMTKYNPPSLAKGGAWAKGVNSFMEELR